MTRVAIYTRVSTTWQEDEGTSLVTQEARCREYAAERGWTVVAIYREVHTGADLFERPQLTALRGAMRKREVDAMLAFALDRLTRNQAHLGLILSEADHADVTVELVTERLEDTPEGRLLQSVRGFVAEMERIKTVERTQRGTRARAESGKLLAGSRPLYGYRWRDASKAAYDIDPVTGAVVQRIFADILKGTSLRSLAQRLTTEGIPTPTGRRQWAATTLSTMLSTPAYTGAATALRHRQTKKRGGGVRCTYRPVDEQIALPEGTVPALVSVHDFTAVEARLALNKQRASRNNRSPQTTLLRGGFARCGYCGGSAVVNYTGRGHEATYRCLGVSADRYGCPGFGVNAKGLDATVWDQVVTVVTQPELIAAQAERLLGQHRQGVDIASINRRVAAIDQCRQRLARAIATLDDDDAAAPLLTELSALADQRRAAEVERQAAEAQVTQQQQARERIVGLQTWCRRVAGNLSTLTYDERRQLLDALGLRVRLFRRDHAPRWEITMAPTPGTRVAPIVYGTVVAPDAAVQELARPDHTTFSTSPPGPRSSDPLEPTPPRT